MKSLIWIILVTTPGVWSGNWGVTLKNQCALKGTSVVINCMYDYPDFDTVRSVGWYKAQYLNRRWQLVALSNIPSIRYRFKYVGNKQNDCGLQINNVQHTDEGAYFFHFKTEYNQWTSRTYAHVIVKESEMTTVVQPSTVTEGGNVSLSCVTGCPTQVNVVWFRDQQAVRNTVFQARREDAGRYYCAMLGQETVRSKSVALNVQCIRFLPIIAGIGVVLFVALVLAVFLFWRKRRAEAERKQPHIGLSGRGGSSSGTEDQPSTIYANIHTLPSSRPAVTDISPHAQKSSHPEYDAPTAHEHEVTYSTVTITPKKPSRSRHINSRALQDIQSKSGENDEFVIYATVAKSS